MMKKIWLLFSLTFFIFVLMACSDQTNTTTQITTDVPTTTEDIPLTTETLLAQSPTVESGYLVDDVQDGLILHAWNWSLENVETHLEDIAIAGFSAVQISPMQPQKDYFGQASWGGSWWKLYQPLGFTIATENHSLGTIEDLESLTEAADLYGIKIIVDVVVNHLSSDSAQSLDDDVALFEPDIFQQNLIRLENGQVSDNSIEAVTRGSLGGLVDLQTETEIVQQAVLDMLIAYVDAGVDGFRFDAAKHVETPNDGDYASDFWPTIINGIENYASEDLYIYGEILNTPGSNRSYADYTPYMSITANGISDEIRTAVITKNASRIEDITFSDELPASYSVLWPESHDDFAAGHTDGLSQTSMNKTYVVQASRKEATTLYFARPKIATFMGDIGTYDWQALEVHEVNRYHNYFFDADESISIQNGFYINERYHDEKEGVVIVDINGTGSIEDIQLSHLANGYYMDQISKEWFLVRDGQLTGEIDESGIAILYNNPYEPKPVTYVSDDGSYGTFSETKDVTIYAYNTTEAYYTINDEEPISFSGKTDIVLSHPELNAVVSLTIDVWYDDYLISKTFYYEKSNVIIEEVVVNNIDTQVVEGYKIVAWSWEQGQEGQWVEGVYSDGTFVFDLPEGHDFFLLVLFPVGTTTYLWDDKVLQTGDTEIPNDGIYDGSQMTWN